MANKIIYSPDEVAHHLAWLTFRRYFSRGPQLWRTVNKFYYDFYKPNSQWQALDQATQARIQKCVRKDIERWVEHVKFLKNKFQTLSHMIEDNLPIMAKKVGQGDRDLGHKLIFQSVMRSPSTSFAKTLGPQLLPKADKIFPNEYEDADDVFIRNIIHNEDILEDRIKNDKPFWFVDSGYTNFIHGGNKRFHRLVRNDLHHTSGQEFPADRLGQLDIFPQPWRKGGDKILVIEPSKYICQMYGIDIHKWRKEVKETLAKHTGMEVISRVKTGTKKTRGNLAVDLMEDESIYCVVHYNSNAGTEAIWAGVPVITLGKHITSSVSRNRLEDINDLYRGPLGNWLCEVSYNQFTFGELIDGTAVEIWEKYHV